MSCLKNPLSCLVCNVRFAGLCGRCRSVRYCSEECLAADRKTHKVLCRPFASFDLSTRPSEDHYLAIFFPVDGERPELVWLEAISFGEGSKPLVNIEPFIGDRILEPSYRLCYNPVLKRDLSDTVILAYRDLHHEAGSKPNKSIAAVVCPPEGYHWHGPLLAFSWVGSDLDSPKSRDITLTDFRHAADQLSTYLGAQKSCNTEYLYPRARSADQL